MAYIEQINEGDAEGILASTYEAARKRGGGVANIIKLMSNEPKSMQGSMQFYVSLMKSPNSLEPRQREMIAAVVSNANDCYY